jgi:hypothetical protein
MKHRVARVILGFSFIALHAAAQTAPAQKPSTPIAATEKPGASASKTPAAPATPEKDPPKIEGMEIKRGAGFMGLAVVGGNFKLTFYDAKKKLVPPDVARAALRWSVNYKPLDERAVLNPSSDGKALTSSKVVKPPYLFKLFITLIPAAGSEETSSETYVVDFRG